MTGSKKSNVYVEKRPEHGDYIMRREGSKRVSAVEPTQKAAIERAEEIAPGVKPHVERLRHTERGSPDKWRKV